MTEKCYRWVQADMTSSNGDISPWEVGVWREQEGELVVCENGLHACKHPFDALGYSWTGERYFLAEAEGIGRHDSDKFVARRMRLVREIDIKPVCVEFAQWCAKRAEKYAAADAYADAAADAYADAAAAARAAAAAAAYAAADAAAAADAYAAAAADAYAAAAARAAAADAYAAAAARAAAADAAAYAVAADAAAYAVAAADAAHKKERQAQRRKFKILIEKALENVKK